MRTGESGRGGYGAEDRRRVRETFLGLGLAGHELLEPLVAEFRQGGCRPRLAWRHANELTQSAVAERYNEIVGGHAMKASRVSEYEAWPHGRSAVRPTVSVLKTLAAIYRTTWDELIDVADIGAMPEAERHELRNAWAKRAESRLTISAAGDLPAEVPHFTGREAAKWALHDRVIGHLHGRLSAVHVIDGPPGIGKTVLARYALAAFARHFPDGPLWFDLHGHTVGREPREPDEVLSRLLVEIGVPPESIEVDPGARPAQWRNAMKARRMLLVFDNVLDSDQVKPLLPQADGCFVLITSRAKLTGLAGSSPLHLDPLSAAEAERLLVRLADLRPGYDAAAVRQILETSGGVPMAIRLIAGQIAHHGEELLADSALEFAALTQRLKQSPAQYVLGESAAQDIMEWFSAEGESMLAAYEVSYRRLRDPAQRRALRLLGWYPGPEISADTIIMAVAVNGAEAKVLLRKLFEAGFLEYSRTRRTGGRRYRMHDLTRLFARLHAEQEDSPSDHAAVLGRLIGGNLAFARQMSTPKQPGPGVGARHAYPEDAAASAEYAQAEEWLMAERENLLACIDAAPFTAETAELARRLAPALWGLSYWADAHWLYDKALQVARRISDRRTETGVLLELGRIDQIGGLYKPARTAFQRAFDIAVEQDDTHRQAEAMCELGQTAWLTGDHSGAEWFYNKALRIACDVGYREAECDARNGLGHVERLACHYGVARQHFQKAGEIADAIGDRVRAASVLWGYGEVVRRMGDTDTARRVYTDALRIARQFNHPRTQGDALRGLGHVARYVGDWEAARRYYSDALEMAVRIRDRHGEAWALWGLGNVERNGSELATARMRFGAAHDIAVELNLTLGQVDILRGIGHIELEQGNHDEARRRYADSLRAAERISDRHGRADGLRSLGEVHAATGNIAEARACLTESMELFEAIGVPLVSEVRAALDRLDKL
ncbi:tetratricopeptide repeat protein [Nocardia sp. XZ_19_385]|uniref:tetratricopeptide repeat protein n=1 Tax=Nocardia sp. XZ_19_385 TaxID=2769488 RepID=UPI00188FC89E|nr:tetratricopeptide repeat protein [Nocardia sp. XZ_19_385]